MKPYKYIPFPKLRQQYRRRQRLIRAFTDITIAVTIFGVIWHYGGAYAGRAVDHILRRWISC